MKLARVAVLAVAMLGVASSAWAQKPDFSGTWAIDPATAPGGGAPGGGAPGGGGGGRGGGRGGGGLGAGGSVKQTADTLTIERTMGDNKVTTTYKLDGSESKNTMMGRGGEPMEMVSTAKWDGAKLVITTKNPNGESTQTWALEGGNLTIETVNARGTNKVTYKKS